MQNALIALAAVTALAFSSNATAQIYSTGPGFSMSLEGRYLQNSGDRARLQPNEPNDKFSDKARAEKGPSGKASLDYRFPNNWDIGVSTSGMRSGR